MNGNILALDKPYTRCPIPPNVALIHAKYIANAIWQLPVVTLQKSNRGRVHSTGVFHIGNATQVNIQKQNFEKMIFLSKTYHPLKKCFLDRFSKFFQLFCQLHMCKNCMNILLSNFIIIFILFFYYMRIRHMFCPFAI